MNLINSIVNEIKSKPKLYGAIAAAAASYLYFMKNKVTLKKEL